MFYCTIKDHFQKSCLVFITTKPALWHYHFTSFQLPWWYCQWWGIKEMCLQYKYSH